MGVYHIQPVLYEDDYKCGNESQQHMFGKHFHGLLPNRDKTRVVLAKIKVLLDILAV